MWEDLSRQWAQPGESVEASWERHQKTLIPQGRAQTPEDMGRLAVFFATGDNVTRQAWNVDGAVERLKSIKHKKHDTPFYFQVLRELLRVLRFIHSVISFAKSGK
ncbi:hypothetical protein ANRL3_03016 [Anaerolineae bacterium]|nr:hypothetical protein ANRL3_03016 [Anaerolineae bacterium]